MLKKVLIIASFGVILSWAETPDPVATLKEKDGELQNLLKEKGTKSPETKKKISILINNIFDLKELGKKALGTETFKTMSDKQKEDFLTAFKDVLETTSIKRLESYRTDSVVYEKPDIKSSGKKCKITAHTYLEGKESVLVYKMKLNKQEWKAWDLVIDDLSTYRNYKEQFRTILKSKTIDDLIEILVKKAKSNLDEDKPQKK